MNQNLDGTVQRSRQWYLGGRWETPLADKSRLGRSIYGCETGQRSTVVCGFCVVQRCFTQLGNTERSRFSDMSFIGLKQMSTTLFCFIRRHQINVPPLLHTKSRSPFLEIPDRDPVICVMVVGILEQSCSSSCAQYRDRQSIRSRLAKSCSNHHCGDQWMDHVDDYLHSFGTK